MTNYWFILSCVIIFFLGIALGYVLCYKPPVPCSKPITVYNVKDFGAKGDGVTDDSKAIQAAVNTCLNNSGGSIFFPNGVYNIGEITLTSRRYFLVSYASPSNVGHVYFSGNKFPSEYDIDRIIKDVTKKDFNPTITNIFEFKDQSDFDDFTAKKSKI